jgi:dihydrofolate reductase
MVAAMAKNRVIGNKGHLPWGHDMPSDIKRYTDLIRGHTIVMGASTFGEADHARSESKVVVLSRREIDLPEGISLVHSVEDVLALDRPDEELFVTGGGGVFHLLLEHVMRLHLTIIDQKFEGDVYFPEVDENLWELITKQDFEKDDENRYDYSFLTYKPCEQ